jgi:hypothetical protein
LAFLNICILGNATQVFVGGNATESPKDAPDLANFVGHKKINSTWDGINVKHLVSKAKRSLSQ